MFCSAGAKLTAHRPGPSLVAGVFQQLRRRSVERLIPADARPARITVPFRSGPFHRVKYAIGTVDQLRRRLTLGTQ
jgi:hypothetical protein